MCCVCVCVCEVKQINRFTYKLGGFSFLFFLISVNLAIQGTAAKETHLSEKPSCIFICNTAIEKRFYTVQKFQVHAHQSPSAMYLGLWFIQCSSFTHTLQGHSLFWAAATGFPHYFFSNDEKLGQNSDSILI